MSDAKDKRSGGLSVTTLVIASLSSLAAAIFIHEFWQGGAILGAAITPIIVSIVSELLRKPTDRVTAVVAHRRTTPARGETVPAPVGVAPEERDDPFGLRDADRPRRSRRVRRRNLGLAFATGLAAFALAGFLLTGTELVIGNPLGGGSSSGSSGSGGGTTIFGGSSSRDDAQDEEERPQEGTTERTPAPEGETPPAEPAPETPETPTPETPEPETPAPEGTTPPGEQAPAPAPAPTPPAPDGTTPDPGGAPAP